MNIDDLPKAAAKKKLATKTLFVATPRHSIRLSERVVKVVAKTPIGSAVFASLSKIVSRLSSTTYSSAQGFLRDELHDRSLMRELLLHVSAVSTALAVQVNRRKDRHGCL